MNQKPVNVVINGKPQEIADGLTVQELLSQIKLSTPAVAVEINLELIPRERHAETRICDGDQLEIVSLVGGG